MHSDNTEVKPESEMTLCMKSVYLAAFLKGDYVVNTFSLWVSFLLFLLLKLEDCLFMTIHTVAEAHSARWRMANK